MTTPWRDDVEATHRKIMIDPAEPIGPAFARGIALQLQADREHMEVLKVAIEGLFLSQQQQMTDATAESKRGKSTEDNVSKLKSACKVHAEQIDERFQQTEERFTWIHENVKPTMVAIIQEITPGMVEARVLGIEAALAETVQFVKESREVMNGFDRFANEVQQVKGELFKHIADTRGKFAARSGVTGAMGVQSVEAAAETPSGVTQIAFDHLYSQVLALSTKCHCEHVESNTARVTVLETDVQRLSQLNGLSSSSWQGAYGSCGGGCAGGCGGFMPPPVPSAFRPGKTPGDLGGEIPACFNQLNGGNGLCHCQHVELLLERVKAIEEESNKEDSKGKDPFEGDDPWKTREAGRRIDAEERRAAREDEDDEEHFDLTKRVEARHLGLLNNDKLDRSLFGGVETSLPEYRFDGKTNGIIWKEKLTQYFMGKVPALWEIMEWAEKHDIDRVAETSFYSVAGHFMT